MSTKEKFLLVLTNQIFISTFFYFKIGVQKLVQISKN